ncbi:hypothetical protein B0T20DRAFT_409407 [Sordaria brevicollis]|uniref:Uncharacterized protein n=1 Tax=Sordaria brevicollis TaxID=83679 RepID=A0AAE0UCJ5_SORBR|nr:hypothetical protein B0T20DRAFT_409407 [Sordaria brevicollis]
MTCPSFLVHLLPMTTTTTTTTITKTMDHAITTTMIHPQKSLPCEGMTDYLGIDKNCLQISSPVNFKPSKRGSCKPI